MSTIDNEGRGTLEREGGGAQAHRTQCGRGEGRRGPRLGPDRRRRRTPVAADADTVLDCGASSAMIDAYRERTLPAARRELYETTCALRELPAGVWQSRVGRLVGGSPRARPLAAWKRWAAAAAVVVAGAPSPTTG